MDWKALIGSVAPTLATALGGPLAGMAVTAVGNALGLDKATEDTVSAALQGATPADLLKVKEADNAFKQHMADLGVNLEKIAADDRASARTASVSGGTAKMLFWLSILLLLATLGTEIRVLFAGYPKDVPEIVVGRILGLMDAVAMMVLAFWYGTTSQSKSKDDTISAMAKG